MKVKERKYQKGITLIALVITIIVLLILAGVTLSIVFNGGIINKSQTAVDKYTEEQAKEKLSLALFEYKMDQVTKKEGTDLQTTLSKLGPVIEAEDKNYYEVEIDGYLFWVHKETLEIISKGPINPIPPTKIEFSSATAEAYIGEGKIFSLTLEPQNANPKFLKWSVSDESVAKIQNGVLTGLKEGTVIVTVTSTEDASITASCTVEVKAVELTEISLNKTETTIGVGKTETLEVTYTPANATYKDIVWSTSDDTIATVENGTVTGVKVGTATITATATSGGHTASCLVTVEQTLEISTISELYKFAQDVNVGNNYSNYTVKLLNDITINEGINYQFDKDTGLVEVTNGVNKFYIGTGYKGDTSGSNATFDSTSSEIGGYYLSNTSDEKTTPIEREVTLSEGITCKEIEVNNIKLKRWEAIGTGTNNFSGVFDGQNKKIVGIYCNETGSRYVGLFGMINSNAMLKNINLINGGFINSSTCTGTVVAYANDYCNLENLHNSNGIIVGRDTVGGIVGYLKVYENITFSKLSNKSDIIGNIYVGGIVGEFRHINFSCVDVCTIEKSFNTGNIYACGHSIGGIAGDVYRSNNAGSEIGRMCINSCYNTGSIVAKDVSNSYIGGIAGGSWPNYRFINNCYNTGNLVGKNYVFGITTSGSNYGMTKNSFNLGNLNGNTCIAGISDYAEAINCYNAGIINATTSSYIGGINSNYNRNYAPYNCHYIKYPNGSATNGVGTTDVVSGISSYTLDNWNFNVLDVVNTDSEYFTTATGRDKNFPILKWEVENN